MTAWRIFGHWVILVFLFNTFSSFGTTHKLTADFYFFLCAFVGITALEMAEGKPPYGDLHPMRAIFMIPTKPPPSFREPDQWSPEFIDFVSR